ncbi:hypothetical protein COLO4_08288 [Corchorus olitorius]|uniref:Uncharacterized protein n=1 Tax=Corchorus olitorius TaxID=93759 RepID=A0A1R3KGF4_9ROSI|nr:hypothetical protein COLO4_08288 [Corchorus olitorius]
MAKIDTRQCKCVRWRQTRQWLTKDKYSGRGIIGLKAETSKEAIDSDQGRQWRVKLGFGSSLEEEEGVD